MLDVLNHNGPNHMQSTGYNPIVVNKLYSDIEMFAENINLKETVQKERLRTEISSKIKMFINKCITNRSGGVLDFDEELGALYLTIVEEVARMFVKAFTCNSVVQVQFEGNAVKVKYVKEH